jgi:hypothetical protein
MQIVAIQQLSLASLAEYVCIPMIDHTGRAAGKEVQDSNHGSDPALCEA